MRINKFFMGLAAAALLSACSSDDIVSDGPSKSAFDAEGNGFLKIAINLPSSASTRAIGDYATSDPGEYGEYNDGLANEYTVENATLCIFAGTGTDELTYELSSVYQLGAGAWNGNTSAEITTDRSFIQKINNSGTVGKKLYAYVILNKHNFFEVDPANNSLKFNSGKPGAPVIECVGKTLADFAALDLKESGRRYDANSFMMTNMPYADVKGGTQKPDGAVMKTLYPIDLEHHIYASQQEAELGAAATEVNVERVLAKVQTNWTYPAGKDYFTTTDGNDLHVKILGWFIDNTNPNTFIGRHYTAPDGTVNYLQYAATNAPTYRFVSRNWVTPGQYRTFWAIDANYDKKAGDGCDALITRQGSVINPTLMSFDPVTGKNIGGDLRAQNSYYYCTENTFDVAHQSEYNTTRVVVAAQFGEEDPITHKYPSFYTLNQEANKYYTLAELNKYFKARIADRVIFHQWVEDFCNSSVHDATDFLNIEITNPMAGGSETAGIATVKVSEAPAGLAAGHIKTGKTITQATEAFKRMVNGDTTPGQEVTGHNAYLASNFVANLYLNGVAYYSALIKHFGEDETPWSKDAHAGVNNDVDGVYDGLDENDYLGRYGIVRNNWYFLEIEGVRQIGSAVVPVLPGNDPDTPDDQIENYLKVKINITPWVIRKQSVTL